MRAKEWLFSKEDYGVGHHLVITKHSLRLEKFQVGNDTPRGYQTAGTTAARPMSRAKWVTQRGTDRCAFPTSYWTWGRQSQLETRVYGSLAGRRDGSDARS